MTFWKRTKTYRIEPREDDWSGPEETLVDAGSDFSDMESPVPDGIFQVGAISVIGALVIVTGYSANIMLGEHDRMAMLSAANRTVTVGVPPPRGLILDRNGVHLVENVPSFDLLAVSRQIEHSGDGTFPATSVLAPALGMSVEDLTLRIADHVGSDAVFFVTTDIGKDAALSLTQSIPSGFYLITSTKRDYLDGEQFSSIVGYVGKVSQADIADDEYYLPSDTIGRTGIEASYESVLRGNHGALSFQAQDQELESAAQGYSLVLNVDAQVQKQLFNILFGILRDEGLSEATAIVQDPSSGAVLGLVSFPSYDNNIFTRPLSQELFSDIFESSRRPLFNRVIGGLYNPGSTIKPFIGMAALQEGVMGPYTTVPDCNAITIPNPSDPDHPYVFRNWRPEVGAFDLDRAIADSCNIYFFTAAGGHGDIAGLGIQKLVEFLRKAGADSETGIDLFGEKAGFVPDPDWKWINRKDQWYQGDTYNVSIGQGDLLVTPLWLNTYISAIANGGYLWQPQLASRVLDGEEQSVQVVDPHQTGVLPFERSVIREMQEAMRQTVLSGTAKILQNLPVSAAAKTGTAEVIKGKKINSLLTVYAPVENPQIAMTVLIEGSPENQGYAIRAAHQFLSWYFGSRTPPPLSIETPPRVPPASVSLGI